MQYSGTATGQPSSIGRVIVNTSQVLEFLETSLGVYMGAASQYLNLKSILYQLIENRISGDVMSSYDSIKKQMLSYGLSVEVIDTVLDTTHLQMNQLFNTTLEYDISEYVCNFNLTGRGDTVLDIMSERNSLVEVSLAEHIQEYLEEADEQWDYIPERVRTVLKTLL